MLPADIASSLRSISPSLEQANNAQTQPVASTQRIADVLSNAVPGQRLLAEIQALLPNGSYRALVAQREITLALPFSAKAGDTLELEVVETDGKLNLALIANRSNTDAKSSDSVATSLSKTGNLIGNLLGEGEAKPAPLNANQPLITTFPEKASDLAPILKDSLIKSGMFYEAHQARWVEGKLATANLLQEPQGKFSSLIPAPSLREFPLAGDDLKSTETATHLDLSPAGRQKAAAEQGAANHALAAGDNNPTNLRAAEAASPAGGSQGEAGNPLRPNPVHPELTAIVQQQLNALASQTYVWQGQVWPGQDMRWEITEDDGRPRSGEDEANEHWQTRLKMDLPKLGGIEARLGLGVSGKLSLTMTANSENGQQALRAAGKQLEESLRAAGMQLSNFVVSHGEITP